MTENTKTITELLDGLDARRRAAIAAARRRRAEWRVADAYNTNREGLPYPMAAGRARHAQANLGRELAELDRNAQANLGTVPVAELEPTRDDMQAALDRKASALLAGKTPSSSVVNALNLTAVELGLERPARLQRLLEGAGSIYTSGGSRAGQRDRHYRR